MTDEVKDDCKALSDLAAELEQELTALKEVRAGKAGAQGELDAKKLLFETQNKKIIDDLALLKESEIALTNKIRYLSLKLHALNGEKKLAGGKVTIKMFREVGMTFDINKVLEWAKQEAPILIKETLDEPAFRAMLEEKKAIEYHGTVIAHIEEAVEPRAQISKTL